MPLKGTIGYEKFHCGTGIGMYKMRKGSEKASL